MRETDAARQRVLQTSAVQHRTAASRHTERQENPGPREIGRKRLVGLMVKLHTGGAQQTDSALSSRGGEASHRQDGKQGILGQIRIGEQESHDSTYSVILQPSTHAHYEELSWFLMGSEQAEPPRTVQPRRDAPQQRGEHGEHARPGEPPPVVYFETGGRGRVSQCNSVWLGKQGCAAVAGWTVGMKRGAGKRVWDDANNDRLRRGEKHTKEYGTVFSLFAAHLGSLLVDEEVQRMQ